MSVAESTTSSNDCGDCGDSGDNDNGDDDGVVMTEVMVIKIELQIMIIDCDENGDMTAKAGEDKIYKPDHLIGL